jgi:hypothetical protein
LPEALGFASGSMTGTCRATETRHANHIRHERDRLQLGSNQ